MKRTFRKYPSNYLKASKDFDEKGIISSVEDMTDFIDEVNLIVGVTEHVNDTDYDWKYNTPEKFAKACKDYLTKHIDSEVKDYGYKIKKGLKAVDLISDEIWDALEEEASYGDFDVDACSDVYGVSNSTKYDWENVYSKIRDSILAEYNAKYKGFNFSLNLHMPDVPGVFEGEIDAEFNGCDYSRRGVRSTSPKFTWDCSKSTSDNIHEVTKAIETMLNDAKFRKRVRWRVSQYSGWKDPFTV